MAAISDLGDPRTRDHSGQLGEEEERENESNQLQEDAEWRLEGSSSSTDEQPLLGTPEPCFCRRHKRFLAVIFTLSLVILANALAVYFIYFRTSVRLKVLAYNVWGMPVGIGGCKDKELRIAALAKEIGAMNLGKQNEDFDLILLEELWMQADHNKIQQSLPKGFHMTEFRDLASSLCDGRALIGGCSGLAIISRYPFKEKEFHQYTYKGSIWDGEAFAGKGVGRVRIEPKENVTVDVFVTHTIADGTTLYNNTWARIRQVEELMDSYVLKSDADVVILGGDFNSGPERGEGTPFQIIVSKGMTNSVQEIFYKLDEWLQPRFATYGNRRNIFSRMYKPVIYDYIFYRTNSKRTVCWTNWFELPFFTTTLFAGVEFKAHLESLMNSTGKLADQLSVGADLDVGENVVISLSDHEPVISTLYLTKWSRKFPYL